MEIPVIICDDNRQALKKMEEMLTVSENMLEENDYMDQIILKFIKTDSYERACEAIKQMEIKYGLYFLDIELSKDKKKHTGIDLAEQIKKIDKYAKIIFVTNYKDMAFLTYQRRIGAVDYIIKSNNQVNMQRRLNDTLEDIIRNYSQEKNNDTISYRLGSRIITINLNNLIYIETSTMPHKLNFVKDNGISFIKGNLKEFENNPKLLRISQSCIINPQKIKEIDIRNNNVILSNGDRIKYSRMMRQIMRNWHMAE